MNNPLSREFAPNVYSLLGIALVGFGLILLQLSAPFLNPILGEHPIDANLPVIARTAARDFGIRTRLNAMTGAGIAVFLFLMGVDYAPLWGSSSSR